MPSKEQRLWTAQLWLGWLPAPLMRQLGADFAPVLLGKGLLVYTGVGKET